MVPNPEMDPPSPKRARCTVADVLMRGSRARDRLPRAKAGKNRKEKLFNDVRFYFESKKVGFSSAVAETNGYELVNVLTNCLWSIDANHDTLVQATAKRGQAKVPTLSDTWRKFSGYNDYKSKKMIKPRLHAPELHQTAQVLFRVAGLPSLHTEEWKEIKEDIESLALTLDGYAEILDECNEKQQGRQKKEDLCRQVSPSVRTVYLAFVTIIT